MRSRPLLVALVFAVTTLGMPVRRDAATVQADLDTLNSQTLSLDASINAFPSTGGTLAQAWDIHTDAVTLDDSTTSATSDANASGAFSEVDGQAVTQYMSNTFVPNVLQSLDDIIAKSAALTAVGANGVALEDLQMLHASADAFWNAVLAKTPTDQQAQVQELLNQVDTAFTSAINAFS